MGRTKLRRAKDACQRKVAFFTREGAEGGVEYFRHMEPGSDSLEGLEVYLCPVCNYWHVGHHNRPKWAHKDYDARRKMKT